MPAPITAGLPAKVRLPLAGSSSPPTQLTILDTDGVTVVAGPAPVTDELPGWWVAEVTVDRPGSFFAAWTGAGAPVQTSIRVLPRPIGDGRFPDLARVRRPVKNAVRVSGRPMIAYEDGRWFRCRLSEESSSERLQDGGWTRIRRPTLRVRPSLASPVEIQAGDRLQVMTASGEDRTYEVDGDPRVSRRRRRVLLLTVALKRAE